MDRGCEYHVGPKIAADVEQHGGVMNRLVYMTNYAVRGPPALGCWVLRVMGAALPVV